MAGMTEDELRALTDQEMRQSAGYQVGKLANARQKALYYYEGLAKGDLSPSEIEGRSSVVSTEVRNVIESMLPELMAKFASSEKVVELDPTQESDEEAAKVATDYLNYLFYKKNDGHKTLLTWFKDALISKVGILKVWWDDRTEETKEEYKGLDDVELAQIADDEEVEVIEHTAYVDEEDQEQRAEAIHGLELQLEHAMQAAQHFPPHQSVQNGAPQPPLPPQVQAVVQLQQQIQSIQDLPPKMLHDITCKRSKKGGKITVENVPPEEFLISRKAKNIKDAPFVGHRIMRTVSELKSMGYKNVDNLSSDDTGTTFSLERVERISFDDEMPYWNADTPSIDESQRLIWVTECYLRCDFDGDGIAELRKVVRAGNQILENEEVDIIPFVSITPITLPHRFFGLSVADLAIEPQRIKTSVLRAMLDNLYLQVNGRYYAVEGQVNLDDLLTSRPGGVVRMKQAGMAGRLDQAAGDASSAMGMLDYLQGFTEEATGWQRIANAVDNPDSLNATATAANIQMNRAQMRVDLIARNFAEGVVDLFRMMLKLVCQHQDAAEDVKLGGKWMSIDPREWRNQFAFTINIGLGTGSKDQQVQHLMMQLRVQQEAIQAGVCTPENIYESCKKLSEALGFKNSDAFWTDPKLNPQPPKPNPEQMKIQAEQANQQASLQADVQKHQAQMVQRQQELEQQGQIRQHELQLEAQKQQLQAQADMEERQHQAELNAALERERMEFERWKLQYQSLFDRETKIMLTEIAAKTTLTSQQMNAAEIAEKDEVGELNGNY